MNRFILYVSRTYVHLLAALDIFLEKEILLSKKMDLKYWQQFRTTNNFIDHQLWIKFTRTIYSVRKTLGLLMKYPEETLPLQIPSNSQWTIPKGTDNINFYQIEPL